jgi:hypothetical protein
LYRKYATPLRLDLQASGYAGWWLLLTHASGLLVLPFTGLPASVMALIAAFELTVLLCCWPRYVSRHHRNTIRVFTWKDGDKCIVMQVDGKVSNATLAPHAFIMPWLVILYFRQGKRARSLFILPDMLSREAFRRLRVRLRTELGQPPEPAQA